MNPRLCSHSPICLPSTPTTCREAGLAHGNYGMAKVRERLWLWQLKYGYSVVRVTHPNHTISTPLLSISLKGTLLPVLALNIGIGCKLWGPELSKYT